jgi:hypothetical protein
MDKAFLPFPRGQTASGINATNAAPSCSFVNDKGEPLIDALLGESERGQVLIATAFLDKAMRGCLAAKFTEEQTTPRLQNTLLGSEKNGGANAALGTFGVRIQALRAFGFISEETYMALEQVRKVRNAFAHKDFKITFVSSEVQPYMRKMRDWLTSVEQLARYVDPQTGTSIPAWRRDLELGGQVVKEPVSESHIFLGATIMLYTLLANVRWAIRKEEFDGAIRLLADRPVQ